MAKMTKAEKILPKFPLHGTVETDKIVMFDADKRPIKNREVETILLLRDSQERLLKASGDLQGPQKEFHAAKLLNKCRLEIDGLEARFDDLHDKARDIDEKPDLKNPPSEDALITIDEYISILELFRELIITTDVMLESFIKKAQARQVFH